MGEPQIIRTPHGDELVVLPRSDYETLLSAAREAEEDAADAALAKARLAAWHSSGRLSTPPEVAAFLLEGDGLLRAFRRHAGLSTSELAERAGIAPGEIVRLEEGGTGSTEDHVRLARALGIDQDWLDDIVDSPAP